MYGTARHLEKRVKLDNGDTQYGCGCVTFWGQINGSKPTVLYRRACGTHKGYAERVGALLNGKHHGS